EQSVITNEARAQHVLFSLITMKYFVVFLLLGPIWCIDIPRAGDELKYDCEYCQPEQIHIAFGIYHVGSMYGWSEEFTFHTAPEGEDWVVRAAIYGDLGSGNAQSLPYLQDEAQRNKYDVILHVGDFAYDMDSHNALVGDEFMRQIQPVAAVVPYMTCPGNHEEKYNFSNYAARFTMPGPDSSLFYSFDLGPVHFVSISTEVYYYLHYGIKLICAQYNWLKKDLEKANLPENRSKRPWIVVFGHRPMYCDDSIDRNCDIERTRIGLNGLWPLEPFLKDYGVDVVIWAHNHLYERSFPLYDNKVYNGSTEYPYVNPGAPVHIITGSAGCWEEHSHFRNETAPWSAFRSIHYGYTRFEAHNKTHLYMEQVETFSNYFSLISYQLVLSRIMTHNESSNNHRWLLEDAFINNFVTKTFEQINIRANMKLLIISLLFGICWGRKLHIRAPGYTYECTHCQPEQIHIAFGEKPNDIVVTWSTFNDTQESRVQYGAGIMDKEATGSSKLFIDGGKLRRSQYIHTVTLKNLEFNTRYVYHAGSVYGWSEEFWFHTPPAGEDWPVRAAIYGDMGNKNAHSLSYLQDEAQRDHFDVILHVGDFAYDMDTNDALVGDDNFSNYAARFKMPGRDSSLFYSFDLGPVHFVSISTEVYYFTRYGLKLIVNQYNWLKEDLAKANLPENR
ncbi:hypothetical protein HF086_003824, partial [Spodoptera exigua]